MTVAPAVNLYSVQKPGKSGRNRRLVDMGYQPEQFVYSRPETADRCEFSMVIFPEEVCMLHCVTWTYRKKIVDFSLTQTANEIEDPTGNEAHVARYDCCHSEVHKHQLYRGGRHFKTGLKEQRTVIAPIDDRNTAWDTVSTAYDQCFGDMTSNWEANYRRWNTDGRQN